MGAGRCASAALLTLFRYFSVRIGSFASSTTEAPGVKCQKVKEPAKPDQPALPVGADGPQLRRHTRPPGPEIRQWKRC
jgi:hypothetical protein